MSIPYADLAGADNSCFGKKYGSVRVSCKDETGQSFKFSSTSMIPSTNAEVFFPRDLNVDGAAPTAAKPPNWFVFWASNMGGPCSWMYNQTSRHAGGRITWAFAPGGSGGATRAFNNSSRFTITLGASDVLDASNTFGASPRYPAAGTFTNSAHVVTNFPAGKINVNFTRQPWQAIDAAEFTVKHELRHVEQRRNWVTRWRGLGNADHWAGPRGGAYEELLPDSYEDGFGTDWQRAVTYPSFLISYGYDSEVDCEVAAGNPDMATTMDWAFPGKQWH